MHAREKPGCKALEVASLDGSKAAGQGKAGGSSVGGGKLMGCSPREVKPKVV
jgi:hypothetical protein